MPAAGSEVYVSKCSLPPQEPAVAILAPLEPWALQDWAFPPPNDGAVPKRFVLYPAKGADWEALERKREMSLQKPPTLQWVTSGLCQLFSWCKSEEKKEAQWLLKEGTRPRLHHCFWIQYHPPSPCPLCLVSPPTCLLPPPPPLLYLVQQVWQELAVTFQCCCTSQQYMQNGCQQNAEHSIGSHFANQKCLPRLQHVSPDSLILDRIGL